MRQNRDLLKNLEPNNISGPSVSFIHSIGDTDVFLHPCHRQDKHRWLNAILIKWACRFLYFFSFYLYKKPLNRDLHLMFSCVTTADVKARSKTSCHLKRLNSDRGLTHLPPSCALEAAIRTVLNLNQQMCAIRGRLCGNGAKWASVRLETPSDFSQTLNLILFPRKHSPVRKEKGEKIRKEPEPPSSEDKGWMRAANGLQTMKS